MTHANIKWIKEVGDQVKIGDILAEVETDKVSMELEATVGGVVLYRSEKGIVEVNCLLFVIGEPGEGISHLLMNEQEKDLFLHGQVRSIRTFIGSKDFDQSREFYWELGFKESILSDDLSYFSVGRFGFYLQKYYVKDWVDNSMIFLEVKDAYETYEHLKILDLPERYEGVKLTPVKEDAWGKECFLHDPSGVLWHFGEFND